MDEQFVMDFILRVGFPIVVIIAMIRGHLVPGFIYDRVVKENERLTVLTEEKVIPLAVEGQQLLRDSLEIIGDLDQQRRELQQSSEKRS